MAGLRVEAKNKEWVVVVQPKAGRLQEARIAIEALTASVLKSRPELENNQRLSARGKSKRRQQQRTPDCCLPALVPSAFSSSCRCIAAQHVFNRAFPRAACCRNRCGICRWLPLPHPCWIRPSQPWRLPSLLPVMGFSIALVAVLRKPGKAGSGTSLIMLAAHEMGPLLLTLAGMVCATWLLWAVMGFSSIARLSAIVIFAAFAGLAAALMLVPAFASLISKPAGEPPADFYDQATAQNLRAIWHKLRPPFTVLLMAVSLFCIVFFSSLNFSAVTPSRFRLKPPARQGGCSSLLKGRPPRQSWWVTSSKYRKWERFAGWELSAATGRAETQNTAGPRRNHTGRERWRRRRPLRPA